MDHASKYHNLMRIAIDVHSLGTQSGGNETYFRQLLRGLAEDISDNRYDLCYTHPAARQEIQEDPRFSFSKIPENPLPRLCASLPWHLWKTKPDIFHCQYVKPPFGKTKTVVAIHDLAHEHYPEFFHPLEAARMKTMIRWTAKRADHILTISEFSAADIARRFNISRERITVAYLSASSEFHPRDKDSCKEHLARTYRIDSPYILYVGRVQARKNLPRLVEAYAQIRKQGIAAKLVIVGKKDWQFERLLEKIKELDLAGDVIFPGYVPFSDLPLFYNAADVFVFPSFFEGFGLPVVESMASGVPTITSFGSSLEEVAGDGALLIDPRDTNAIAEALKKILGDQAFAQQLSQRGLLRSAQFKPSILAAKTLEVYRSIA
jgi:glycosyltransferase involved in cell wall biosynthesis